MTSLTATWTPPAVWSVPPLWAGQRCFVICGGESVKAQRHLVPQLKGPVIAVKEGVFLRPRADVVFFAGERPAEIAPPVLQAFRGQMGVVRGKGHPVFPEWVKRVDRTPTHEAWSDDPTRVTGFDSGTSAISLAMLFGATEIVVLGYDMTGGRWFNGEIKHFNPYPAERDFQAHMAPLPSLALDAIAKGVRIVNVSPISRVTCFERASLEAFL